MGSTVKCIKDFPPSSGFRYDEDLWHAQHGDALVIINCRASDIYYPEHWTPLSLKFAFSGKEYYRLRNTTYAVNDENFLVLNQGNVYESYIYEDTESLTVNYTQNNINQLIAFARHAREGQLDEPFPHKTEMISFFERLYPYDDRANELVSRLRTAVNTESPDSFAITEITYYLLQNLYQLDRGSESEADTIDAKKNSTRHELYKRLTVARDYLHSCYEQNITLEQLAEACYLNQYYLLRQFKKQFGNTPHQYLTTIRLREAEKLVRRSAKPITEIMNSVGFEDQTSFGKLFRKTYGFSPLQYRNKKRN